LVFIFCNERMNPIQNSNEIMAKSRVTIRDMYPPDLLLFFKTNLTTHSSTFPKK